MAAVNYSICAGILGERAGVPWSAELRSPAAFAAVIARSRGLRHRSRHPKREEPGLCAGLLILCRRLLALEGALAGASHPVLARQACALRVAYSNLVGMFDQLREAPAEGCGTKNYEEYLQRHRLSGFVLARTARLPMPNMAPSGSRRLSGNINHSAGAMTRWNDLPHT